MKRLFFTSLLCIISVMATAQSKPQTGTPYNVQHIVGPTQNKIKKMVEYSEGGTKTKYIFNIDGTLAAQITMSEQGNQEYTYQWSNGKLISINSSDGTRISLQHDYKGNLIKESRKYKCYELVIEYSYNSDNLVTKMVYEDFCYDWIYENGELTTKSFSGIDHGSTCMYENGLITKSKGGYVERERDYEATYRYTFNEFNDWTTCIECCINYDEVNYDLITSIDYYRTIREFTYYN